MPEHDRAMHVQKAQRLGKEVGLRERAIAPAPWPLAMAVPRPVERDDAVVFACLAYQPAEHEVFDHASEPVQENERRALPHVDVVQPHAVDGDESPERRICALHRFNFPPDPKGSPTQSRRPARHS